LTRRACCEAVAGSIICTGLTHAQPFDFPLHVGDRWKYQGEFAIDVTVAAETTMQNGRTYAVLDYASVYGLRDFHFLRDSGNYVFRYNPSIVAEQLLYQFDKADGDTVTSLIEWDTIDIVCNGPISWNVLGTPQPCGVFSFVYRHIVDLGESRILAGGLGVVGFDVAIGGGNILSTSLVGARINGVVYGDLTDVPGAKHPVTFALGQNYPNPFNPATTIQYTIGAVCHVRLVVYDILGKKMATLVDAQKYPGMYNVQWDASGLAGGVFFYQMEVGGIVDTRKLVLLR
jgi:hypothetical protein